MGETSIEWTDRTWNPLRGCSRISDGCRNCYAERVAARFSGPRAPFEGFAKRTAGGPRWTGKVELVRERLRDPIHWRKPSRVFVNSMSDLFHESLSDEAIDEIFGIMLACEYLGSNATPGHTFQVLTKRADRMARYFATDRREKWARSAVTHGGGADPDGLYDQVLFREGPHPRIWLGVSVENQEAADERIPQLIQVPAAVRFLSVEPQIGPVDLSPWIISNAEKDRRRNAAYWAFTRQARAKPPSLVAPEAYAPSPIDWVIVGGESGPGARPFEIAWARSLVEQCKAAGVACFVKQLGALPAISIDVTGNFRTHPTTGKRQLEMKIETLGLLDRKGGDPAEWPEQLRVRQFPEVRR